MARAAVSDADVLWGWEMSAADEYTACPACGGDKEHYSNCPIGERIRLAYAALPEATASAFTAWHKSNDKQSTSVSDGSTAAYYELPPWARELADLIRYKKMNGSQAEMFRALYRGSEASHSDEKRQAKKLLAYAVDEVVRTHFPEESFAFYRNGVFEAIFGEKE